MGPGGQAAATYGNFVTMGSSLITPGALALPDPAGWTQLCCSGPGGPTRCDAVFYDDGSGQKLYALDPYGTIKLAGTGRRGPPR